MSCTPEHLAIIIDIYESGSRAFLRLLLWNNHWCQCWLIDWFQQHGAFCPCRKYTIIHYILHPLRVPVSQKMLVQSHCEPTINLPSERREMYRNLFCNMARKWPVFYLPPWMHVKRKNVGLGMHSIRYKIIHLKVASNVNRWSAMISNVHLIVN